MVNYSNVKDTGKLAQALRQADILGQIVTYFPVPGGESTRKVQYDYFKMANNVKITDEYQFAAQTAEIFSASRPQRLLTAETEFPRRDYSGSMGGNEGNLPALTIDAMAYNHIATRTEYCLMGDAKYPLLEGMVAASGTDSLEKPSTVESTPGTAETPGATYTDAGDLTKMAPQTDLNVAIKRLAIMQMRKDNSTNPIMTLMHPIAAALLDSYNYAKAGSGSATWDFGDKSNLTYFKDRGKVLEVRAIDSDYVGADAGTTQFCVGMNYQLSLFVGVGKPVSVDDWWMNNEKTQMYGRTAEALVPIALPIYKDSSNDYFKPFVWLTTTPFS